MNLTLNSKAAVHAATRANLPACNTARTGKTFQQTDREVTCKRCLKTLADREEAAARVAYYAGLRDQQDGDLSQAEAPAEDYAGLRGLLSFTETPAPEAAAPRRICGAPMYDTFRGPARCVKRKYHDRTTEGPEHQGDWCCEHASMYHSARGCDECPCSKPRQVPPTPETDQTSDRQTVTVNGSRFTVKADTDPEGNPFLWWKAGGLHDEACAWSSCNQYSPKGSQNRDIWDAWQALAQPGIPADEKPRPGTDPTTGLPVVTVDGLDYVVGLRQRAKFGNVEYVDFWRTESRTGMVSIRRAYADSEPGTVARNVWDAQQELRLG